MHPLSYAFDRSGQKAKRFLKKPSNLSLPCKLSEETCSFFSLTLVESRRFPLNLGPLIYIIIFVPPCNPFLVVKKSKDMPIRIDRQRPLQDFSVRLDAPTGHPVVGLYVFKALRRYITMAIGLGWLLITQKTLMLSQRIALTLLILALFAGTLYFIMGLRRGFRKNRESMINKELALGMYDSGAYLEEISLLPEEYSQLKGRWSDHFHTLYVWLILVALALLILTWTSPKPMEDFVSKVKTEQVK